jgi:hypothetical protein
MNTAEKLEPMKPNNNYDTRLALLEQTCKHVYQALEQLTKRFDVTDKNFAEMNARINLLDAKFDLKHDSINSKIDANNKWLIGMGVTIIFSCASLLFTVYNVIQ